MPITDTEKWQVWVDANKDPYGSTCINVAKRVMEILDGEPGDFDCHEVVTRADSETKAGGITGFMAGAVARMVSGCHSRGEEFRKKWNADYLHPGQQDNGGVVNPAILTIDIEE